MKAVAAAAVNGFLVPALSSEMPKLTADERLSMLQRQMNAVRDEHVHVVLVDRACDIEAELASACMGSAWAPKQAVH